MTFDDQVAIVTGAGGGLGRCHALELARRGARVVVNDLGSAVDGSGASTSAAQSVVDEITAAGGIAVANGDSVASEAGGAAIVAAAMDAFGQVDILVNNAGILRDAAFKNMTAEQVDAVIAVHLAGAFNVTRAVWPVMREQNYGRIVQTTSGTGLFGNFGQANYGAAKMGLVGMMHVLAIEGARNGIAINAIAPIARTRMTEDIMGEAGKAMDPELVTPVVVYLAHNSCDRTAHIYSVGAGKVSRVFIGVTQGDRGHRTERRVGGRVHRPDRRQLLVHHPRRTRQGLSSESLEPGLAALGERQQALLQVRGARHHFRSPGLLLEGPVSAGLRRHRQQSLRQGQHHGRPLGQPSRDLFGDDVGVIRCDHPIDQSEPFARRSVHGFAEHQQFGGLAQPDDSRQQVDRTRIRKYPAVHECLDKLCLRGHDD